MMKLRGIINYAFTGAFVLLAGTVSALEPDSIYHTDFTDTNTYAVMSGVDGVDGWDAKNQGIVDTNGTIDVKWNFTSTNIGFSAAVNSEAATSALKDSVYTSSIEFSFEIDPADNAGNGALIQSGFFSGPTNDAPRLAITVTRSADVYRLIAVDNWGNSYPTINGVENQFQQSSTYTEASLGLDFTNSDFKSDDLKLVTTLAAGADTNSWVLSAELVNLTSNQTVKTYSVANISWPVDEGDLIYGGFGTGQGGANIKVANRYVTAYEYLELLPPTALVQWGKPGGASTDIVDGTDPALTNGIPSGNNWYKMAFADGSQYASEANTTYQPGDVAAPTNTTYYTNNAGFSPDFNFTFNNRFWDKAVRDYDPWNMTDDYDLIEISGGNGVSNIQYMLTWESFITDPTSVEAFEVEIQADDYTMISSDLRFIFKANDGAWYASEATVVDGSGWTAVSIDAATVPWYEFSVMTNGAAVIGAAATPELTDIQAAGIWYNRNTVIESPHYGSAGNVRFFRVSGRSGSLWQAFVDLYGISGDKTAHSDSDGLNDYGEYVFGGDPTDAENVGVLPEWDISSGKYMYSLVGDASVTARIQTSENLVLGPWTTIDTVVPADMEGLMQSYTNDVGTAEPKKFIRISVD